MDVEKIDTMYGKFFCWRDEPIARQLKQFSAHTRNEIAMLRRLLRGGDIVLDIGAHIGTYAVPLARAVAPGGRVIAFEANAENFSLLARNIEVNELQGSVETICGIVTDAAGTFESRRPDGAHSGMFYFVETSARAERPQGIHLDGWLAAHSRHSRVTLLKIDVEGAELAVLRSSRQTIERQLPMLYVEIAPSSLARFHASVAEVDDFLRDLGYQFFRNVGERNSRHDEFKIDRMSTLAEGGTFFDLLAIHPVSSRYADVVHELGKSHNQRAPTARYLLNDRETP